MAVTTAGRVAVPAEAELTDNERLDLMRRYATAYDLRNRARKILPNFAFEYIDGGAGAGSTLRTPCPSDSEYACQPLLTSTSSPDAKSG